MNNEQLWKLQQVDRDMVTVKQELSELSTFGWQIASDPLKTYRDFQSQLWSCYTDIQRATPKQDSKRLEELVTREGVLTEQVFAAARAAREVLRDEQMRFFEKRDTFTAPLDGEIAKADGVLVKALEQFHKALQTRWTAMQKKAAVARCLAVISERYETSPRIGESPSRLPKPFSKVDLNGWGKFCGLFLSRVGEIFQNAENSDPADIARSVYER